MRNLPTVAKRELGAYLRSPAGFLVGALFLTLQGVVMWLFIRFLARPDAPPGAVMEFFFGGTFLYWIAVTMLATVIPMRLIAEELRSGTIEPLLTAPVTPFDLVLGKWIAAFVFYGLLWVPTLLYLVFLRAHAHVDPGPVAAGYLGTLLVGAALLAVGLFASSLTRNQLLAAALAFVGTFVLLLLGVIESQAADPMWAAILRQVSLFRIMEDFGHGIVDTRHVVALLTLAVLPLLATLRSVAAVREQGTVTLRGALRRVPAAASAVLVVAIALMVNYLAGRHYVRADWTAAGVYSLSEKTVGVLRALPRRVDVTVFFYPRRGAEESRAVAGMVRETLEHFKREAGDRIAVELVDPDRRPERAEAMQKKHGVGDMEMAEGVVIFAAGERSKFVTSSDLVDYSFAGPGGAERRIAGWKGEGAFLGAILSITQDKPAEICFSKGHGEPDIESYEDGAYAYFAEEIRRDGDRTRAVDNLAKGVPPDCSLLIVAEPQVAWQAGEVAAVDAYLGRGGRVLAALGPVFTQNGAAFGRLGLEELAEKWGVRLGHNLVVDPERASDVEGPSVWAASGESYGDHDVASALRDRITFWPRVREVRPVTGSALDARVLVKSGADGWAETDLGTIRGDSDLTFDAGRDVKGPVPVAVAVEAREGGARFVVLGTGRLVMNYRLGGLLVRDYNRDFALSAVAWLLRKEQRIGVGPKTPEHVKLVIEGRSLDMAFRIFVLGLPLAWVTAAGLVWRRRRS